MSHGRGTMPRTQYARRSVVARRSASYESRSWGPPHPSRTAPIFHARLYADMMPLFPFRPPMGGHWWLASPMRNAAPRRHVRDTKKLKNHALFLRTSTVPSFGSTPKNLATMISGASSLRHGSMKRQSAFQMPLAWSTHTKLPMPTPGMLTWYWCAPPRRFATSGKTVGARTR